MPIPDSPPPTDTSMGWKYWSLGIERFWSGIQWTDTYRDVDDA